MPKLTVPVEEIGPEHHCLGHVGLTEEGFQLVLKALSMARLYGSQTEYFKYDELIKDFMLTTPTE